MESATPGVKSTRDGWLNRYLQVAREAESAADGRGDDAADAARAAGPGPVTVDGQRRRVRRARRDGRARLVRGRLRFCGRPGAERHGATTPSMRCGRCRPPAPDHGSTGPADGAVYPRTPFGQSLQEIARLAKADVGLEIAFAESTQWDHHVNEGGATGQIANRLGDFADGLAALAQRSRRPHGRYHHPDDVRVRADGRRERQPRHRSRPWQRDAADRRQRQGRRGVRRRGPASPRASASKGATWPSPRTSATFLARS